MEIKHYKYNQSGLALNDVNLYGTIIKKWLNIDNNNGYGYCSTLMNLYKHIDNTFTLVYSMFDYSKAQSVITLMRFNPKGLCIIDNKCYGNLHNILKYHNNFKVKKIDYLQTELELI